MLYLVCCSGLVFIYFAVYCLVVFCMVDFLAVLVTDCGLCWCLLFVGLVFCGRVGV